MWEALFVLRVLCFLGSSNHSWASEEHRWCNALWRNRLSPFCPQCQSHWPTFQWKDFLLPTSNKYFTHLKWCKHKWNVLNGHPVHWKSFNRAPLRCEMATTGTQVSLLLSVSHAHTLWNTHKGKKEHLIFSVSKTVHTPQPSDNLLLCVYRVFGAKVSLNLSPQSQTSGKPQRNNVYFLSALAPFLTMLSVHRYLIYLTNSLMICSSCLWMRAETTLPLILYYFQIPTLTHNFSPWGQGICANPSFCRLSQHMLWLTEWPIGANCIILI